MGATRKQQMQTSSLRAKEEGTHVTTASSGYDSFLNTCCCADGHSTDSWDSFLAGPNKKRNSKFTGRSRKEEEYDHVPLAEKLSDALLSLVGAAPPIKFIKCMQCSNDELSEMTTPRVLRQMAEEYDQNNIWSVSSDEGDCETEGNASHFLFPFKRMKSSACSVISRISRKKGGRSRGSTGGSRVDMNDPITSQRSINEPNLDIDSSVMTPSRRQAKMKSTTSKRSAKPKKNARAKPKDAKPKKSHPTSSNEKQKPGRWRARRTVAMKPPAELHPGASMASNTTYRNTKENLTFEI
mmetsp:Transcript_34172/g.81775  ORF Transcript_34172/g.81775 Transcript_34172/m.81775 type:complete len:296 (+) Transcript_34172:242-1129(+)